MISRLLHEVTACRYQGRRGGSVVVAIVALLAVAMALFAAWAQATVREHRQLRLRSYELQARRLAEAGVRRAVAQRRFDSTYQGETWQIDAGLLGGSNQASVQISIEQQSESDFNVSATAEFPSDAVRSARHTAKAQVNPTEITADPGAASPDSGDDT